MSTSDYDICKEFAGMDDNIVGVGIIENMKIVAAYSNGILPVPKGEKFQQRVIQSEIFISMAKSNTDFFGRLRYVSMSFETVDVLLFSLPNESNNNKPRLCAIRVFRPYDMTKLLTKLHIA